MSGLRMPPGSLGPWSGGQVMEAAHCLLAPNPGPMTLDGTNTWVVAAGAGGPALVIDPGPDDPEHLDAIADHLFGRDLTPAMIVLTHGHADHSEGARSLADRLRVPVRAVDPAHRIGADSLSPGSVIDVGDVECHVVATPGHTSDSASLVLRTSVGSALLTGDTVLGRGTTVVAHPDGRLADYLASLMTLRAEAEETSAAWVLPGHGPALADPVDVIDYYLEHRTQRLEQVAAAVEAINSQSVADDDIAMRVVEMVYADVPASVWPAALLSVRAQLEYLRHLP